MSFDKFPYLLNFANFFRLFLFKYESHLTYYKIVDKSIDLSESCMNLTTRVAK